ncbi:MAG: hypothetical protein WC394_02865 [Candidatus Omnitrophota bacterium]|jgi:hypothetical protein
MNGAMLQMLVKAIGLKPEAINELINSMVRGQKDIEDIKVLLSDSLEVNKQILEVLKKRGEK